MTRRKFWAGGAALAALLAGYAGTAVWRAVRATQIAAAHVAASRVLRFETRTLDRALPAVEPLSAAAGFVDAVRFRGDLFITTPSALLEYDTGGTVRNRWRSGLELPGMPLGVLAANASTLWVATRGAGLLEFDGQAFRQVLPEDAAARKVTALLPLDTGRLLVGTAGRGVVVWDGKSLAPFDPSLAGWNVTALAGDVGSLWIGTADRGVYHWHGGALDHFAEAEGLPDPQVTSLLADAGEAFVGTPMGIAEFRDGRFVRKLAEGFFTSALALRGSELLAGSLEEGVAAIPLGPRVPRPVRQPRRTLEGAVRRLFPVDSAMLALTSSGLYGAEGAELAWKRAIGPEPGKLADGNIAALSLDRSGRLWVGYFDRGLDVMDGERVTHFESDTLFCINRIVANPADGTTLVATANGLAIFDGVPAVRQVLGKAQGLAADHVTDVAAGPGGVVVATPAGLTVIDASGTHSVSDFHGLVNRHVYALAQDGGELLAGTLGGLSVFEGGIVKASYTTFNSRLRHNWITAIERVGDGWFAGTYGAGVMRLGRNGEWDAFPDLRGAIVINPNAMLVTPSRVYAGTMDRGLAIYDRASGRWNFSTGGLPSVNVTALAAGGGTIYIGTDNGLVRVAEQSLR